MERNRSLIFSVFQPETVLQCSSNNRAGFCTLRLTAFPRWGLNFHLWHSDILHEHAAMQVPALGVYRGGKSLLLNRLMGLKVHRLLTDSCCKRRRVSLVTMSSEAPYEGGFGVGHGQQTFTRQEVPDIPANVSASDRFGFPGGLTYVLSPSPLAEQWRLARIFPQKSEVCCLDIRYGWTQKASSPPRTVFW